MKPDEDLPELASPVCYLHEIDPAYSGLWPTDASSHTKGPSAMPALPAEAQTSLSAALLHGLPDAIVYSNGDGIIQFWNAGATRIFGFTEAEALGKSLDIIIPERLRARHWQGYRQVMESGQSSHSPDELLSVPALTKSGDSLSIQFTIAAVPDQDGRIAGIVAVLRDVTETFAELKRLRAVAKE